MKIDGLFQEYLKYNDDHVKIYGVNTVVLYMKGTFYEIYGMPQGEGWLGPDMRKLEDILNIRLSRTDKSKELSMKNPNMMGVPCDSLLRHQDNLLKAKYTVVMVEQVTSSPNPERRVTAILSPSTIVDGYKQADTNYLLSMYLDVDRTATQAKIYTLGISAIDVSTGKNHIHEVKSLPDEEELWLDEVFRIIHIYNPSEIILHAEDLQENKFQGWCHRLQIDPKIVHHNFCQETDFKKISYQNQFYRKVYPDTGTLDPIEYLGLENSTVMRMAHIYMVQFVHEHKIENVRGILRPNYTPPEQIMRLTSNAIHQLYVVDNRVHEGERFSSLMSLLNQCQTSVGRRLFKERLLNPVVNPEILRERYDQIEKFQENTLYKGCHTSLKNINDIERSFRKMGLGTLTPDGFARLDQSLVFLRVLADLLKDAYPLSTYNALDTWMREYNSVFVLSSLEDYEKTEKPMFVKGVSTVIDDFHSDLEIAQKRLECIRARLGNIIDPKKKDIVKLKHDKNGLSLIVTKTRAKTLKQRLENMSSGLLFKNNEGITFLKIKNTDINTTKTNSKNEEEIYFDYTQKLCNKIEALRLRIYEHSMDLYNKKIDDYYQKNRELYQSLSVFLGTVDLNVCMAKIAIENVYSKPEIVESDRSFFDATQIRHPLVEKIQTICEYVPNDVRLDESGILLFGTNACGKSTLMKSIGLAILMAQAGFFVPCQRLRYSPYTQLFTRILNNDNIFRNQSSFQVEISELRSITRNADNRSLVLGDELCSGTETLSAMSIMYAGLVTMAKKKCSYIFTSHLHQLMEVEKVRNIPNLRICHMEVTVTPEGYLVYNRKLKDGSGTPNYGLVVCNAMDMGSDFDSLANEMHMALTGKNKHLVNIKKSSYNAKVHMDDCGVCGKPSCEAHHIKEQQSADANGNIGNHHKNIAHNIVPLCEACHQNVHHGNLVIDGYKQTSQGVKLDYKLTDETEATKPRSRGKLTDEELLKIAPYIEKVREKKMTMTECRRKIQIEVNLDISAKTVGRIVKKEGAYKE